MKEKVNFQQLLVIISLFLSLQLYVSLNVFIFQRMENKIRSRYKNRKFSNVITEEDGDFLVRTFSLASQENVRNSSKHKWLLKVLRLRLNHAISTGDNEQRDKKLMESFACLYSSLMTSVLLIGNGDYVPKSKSSGVYNVIFLTLGFCIVIANIIKISSLLLYCMERLLKKLKLKEKFVERIKCFVWFPLYLTFLLTGAAFFDSNYMSGLVMATDTLTKTGNYKLRLMKEMPKHPFAALVFSLYILLGLSILYLGIQHLIKLKCDWLDHIQYFPLWMQRIINFFKDKDGAVLAKDQFTVPRKKEQLTRNTFDPPVQSEIRSRLSFYNRLIARPTLPFLVIKETSPDIHGEYINILNEKDTSRQTATVSPLKCNLSKLKKDSWEEFLRPDDHKYSASEYSFDGSFSSDSTDLDSFCRNARGSEASDSNVVTDYPWLEPDVNILELTEQNLKLMFGNEGSKGSGDSKEDSRVTKVSLSRKNAVAIKEETKKELSSSSNGTSKNILHRSLSRSKNKRQFSGNINKKNKENTCSSSGNTNNDSSDDETYMRPRPHKKISLTVNKTPVANISDVDLCKSNDLSQRDTTDRYMKDKCDHYAQPCSGNLGHSHSIHNEMESKEDTSQEPYLDHLSSIYDPLSKLNSTSKQKQLSPTVGGFENKMLSEGIKNKIGVSDRKFAHCFGVPVRSISDMSARSINLINLGDVLYSDEENTEDSPAIKKQRTDETISHSNQCSSNVFNNDLYYDCIGTLPENVVDIFISKGKDIKNLPSDTGTDVSDDNDLNEQYFLCSDILSDNWNVRHQNKEDKSSKLSDKAHQPTSGDMGFLSNNEIEFQHSPKSCQPTTTSCNPFTDNKRNKNLQKDNDINSNEILSPTLLNVATHQLSNGMSTSTGYVSTNVPLSSTFSSISIGEVNDDYFTFEEENDAKNPTT